MGVNKNPYPDPWVDDGKLWCYYNVTTTESATAILNNVNSSNTSFSAMEIDGVSMAIATSHTFSSTGRQLVKYTLKSSTTIGKNGYDQAFFNVTTLVAVYIPYGVTKIGDSYFRKCTNLVTVIIPETLTTFGTLCFNACTKININKLQLPYLTAPGNQAWADAGKIHKILDYGSVTSMGTGNYSNFTKTRIDTLIIPNTVTTIKTENFYQCYIKYISVPTSITAIGKNAFTNNSFVHAVFDMPNLETLATASGQNSVWNNSGEIDYMNLGKVTYIPSYCIGGSTKLHKVVIPDTCTSLQAQCFNFNHTTVKTEYIVYATTPPTYGSGAILKQPAVIRVPAESVDTYKTTSGWSTWANYITAIEE